MKIVLIGDSIRLGYQDLVRRKAAGRAEVWGPQENCRHSLWHRWNLEAWFIEPQPDVIHFNCGIHDCYRLADGSRALTLGEYVRQLRLLTRHLKVRSTARLIWATTTPMLTPSGRPPKAECGVDPAVVRYNEAALAVMSDRSIEVNDLFGAVMDAGACECLSEDKVHMTPFGNEVLSDAIIRFVLG